MEEKQQPELNFTHPALVRSIFLAPQKYTGERNIIEKSKILSQTYETIYNLFEAKKNQFETYFPDFNEIYEDLEFRKKNISDKNPMPSRDELLKILFILATYEPPMIFILRELNFANYSQIDFVTKITFPYNDNIEYVHKGIQHVIHNSLVNFRNHISEISSIIQIKENLIINEISDIDAFLENYQLEGLLKKIYYSKNQFQSLKDDDIKRINTINQNIKKFIFIPLLQELVQNKIIINIKRKLEDITLSDVFLINDLFQIELRFNLLLDVLFQPQVRDLILNFLTNEDKQQIQSKYRIEQATFLAEKIIQYRNNVPRNMLSLALEILNLKDYIDKQKKTHEIEEEKNELQNLIKRLYKTNGILRIKSKKKLLVSEKITNYILHNKINNILFATYPVLNPNALQVDNYEEIFICLANEKYIGSAIEQAIQLFNKTQDIYLIRILEQMLNYHSKPEEELNTLIPSYLRNDFRDTIIKSYIIKEPFFKRIFLYIFKDNIKKEQLKTYWMDYVKKHQYKTKDTKTEQKQIPKITRVQDKEIESLLKKIYPQLITKIEWYLEREFFPDEKTLIKDFPENRKEIMEIIEMAKLEVQSFESLIPLQTKDNLYLFSKNYLIKNKENLLKKYNTKLKEIEGISTSDGKIISLKSEQHKKELYEKIIRILNYL